jgi:hypothetical protein
VELHHLHVFQGHAHAERHGHPVTRTRVGVRRARVEAPGSAGGEDDGLRADRLQAAAEDVPADDALAAPLVLDELPREVLLVAEDVALHQLLVEHVDEHVTRDVGGIGSSRGSGGAERPLSDPPVLEAGEDGAPVLELVHVSRRLAAEHLDRVLVAEVVGALDGVERVDLGVVLRGIPESRVDAPLGGAGMAAHGVDLRDDRHVSALIERLDRGAHAGAAGANHEHVVLCVHQLETLHERP